MILACQSNQGLDKMVSIVQYFLISSVSLYDLMNEHYNVPGASITHNVCIYIFYI